MLDQHMNPPQMRTLKWDELDGRDRNILVHVAITGGSDHAWYNRSFERVKHDPIR